MNYKIECWGKADLERLPKGTHTDECLEGSVLEEQAILKQGKVRTEARM